MSHAHGQVVSEGRKIAYFEYDGTGDVVIPALWATEQEVSDHWREYVERKCCCGHPPIEVVLYTDYGAGFHWPGKVCMNCAVVVGGFIPAEDDTPSTDGHPLGEPHWSETLEAEIPDPKGGK